MEERELIANICREVLATFCGQIGVLVMTSKDDRIRATITLNNIERVSLVHRFHKVG